MADVRWTVIPVVRAAGILPISIGSTAFAAWPTRYIPTQVEADDARLYARDLDHGLITGQRRQWTGEEWIKSVFFWDDGDTTVVPATYENAEAVLLDPWDQRVAYGMACPSSRMSRSRYSSHSPPARLTKRRRYVSG